MLSPCLMLKTQKLPLAFSAILDFDLTNSSLRKKCPPQLTEEENGVANKEKILCPSGVSEIFTECIHA